jgi:hypothetical protein
MNLRLIHHVVDAEQFVTAWIMSRPGSFADGRSRYSNPCSQ